MLGRKLVNKIRHILKFNKSVENLFTQIYTDNYWGGSESVSGRGSNRIQTAKIIVSIPKLLEKYKISSMLDLPCGDFNWVNHMDLNGIRYIGGDIVKELIYQNNLRYGNALRTFEVLNIINDNLPKTDLILCRDCFVHLNNQQILASLMNIKKHKIKYLLTTSFNERNENLDIETGEWRPLNMEVAPFNLTAKEVINENCTENDGVYHDKSLILVEMADW